MNEQIMRAAGFDKEVEKVKRNLCPVCKKQIIPGSFRDSLSEKEFQISGLCQICQDDFFEEKEG